MVSNIRHSAAPLFDAMADDTIQAGPETAQCDSGLMRQPNLNTLGPRSEYSPMRPLTFRRVAGLVALSFAVAVLWLSVNPALILEEYLIGIGVAPSVAEGRSWMTSVSIAVLVTTALLLISFRSILARNKFQYEYALEDIKRQFASYAAVINANAIVSITDSTGVILEVNEKFLNVFGFTREEVLELETGLSTPKR